MLSTPLGTRWATPLHIGALVYGSVYFGLEKGVLDLSKGPVFPFKWSNWGLVGLEGAPSVKLEK